MLRALHSKNPSTFQGVVPDEFEKELQTVKEIRDYTQDVVKYMTRMVRTAIPPTIKSPVAIGSQKQVSVAAMDELQILAKTCENSMHFFYEQRYYYVLKTTAEACHQVSKRQKAFVQETYDRSTLPIKLWVEEDYPRLVSDLKRCQKLKKENDNAAVALAGKPTPTREAKANNAKEQYDAQLRICQGEMEKTKKIRKHHTNCLKIMAVLQYKNSKTALEEIEKAQAQLSKQLAVLDEQEAHKTGKSTKTPKP